MDMKLYKVLKAPHITEQSSQLSQDLKQIVFKVDKNLHLASRNIPNVNVVTTAEINPVMLLKPHKIAITPEAFKKIEELI